MATGMAGMSRVSRVCGAWGSDRRAARAVERGDAMGIIGRAGGQPGHAVCRERGLRIVTEPPEIIHVESETVSCDGGGGA